MTSSIFGVLSQTGHVVPHRRIMAVTVVVPPGLVAGDTMRISLDGLVLDVIVPPGIESGQQLEVNLPDDGPNTPLVSVPTGLVPGDHFSVAAADGSELSVQVPEGAYGGMQIELCLSGGDDEDLTCEPLHPGTAVTEPAAAARPAHPAGTSWEHAKYVADEQCMCCRASGDYTPCTILEYDDASETYTVELRGPGGPGSGLLKYGVEESYISPLHHTVENAGAHFVGRRVQVPHLAAYFAGLGRRVTKDDVSGTIRAFDGLTQKYTVALDNGELRKGVLANQITTGLMWAGDDEE